MDIRKITGSIVALITPFKEDGGIDFASLDKLVDFHLQIKTDAILVLGTTGESSTMTDAEDIAVAKRVIERVNGAVPVIGGAGSNSTAESLAKARGLAEIGCEALLLITPYYNKSNEEGMYRHFVTVADDVPIPSILYNVPGRTGCQISLSNVKRLAEHPNIMGIKEASGNIAYATEVARSLSDNFCMFSGNDDMVIPIMSLGGKGVISVWANVQPLEVHNMVAAWLEGNYEAALKAQLEGLDLIHALFAEVNPIPVKAACAMMGLCDPIYRLPLFTPGAAAQEKLEAAMRASGLI